MAKLLAYTLVVLIAFAGIADAKGSYSSGRSSSFSSSAGRSSSFSAPKPSGYSTGRPSAPSSSGYSSGAKPSAPSAAPARITPSASDVSVSRKMSNEALVGKPSAPNVPTGSAYQPTRTYRSAAELAPVRTTYYSSYHWSPPVYVVHASPSYGAWDGMFMWMMLDTMAQNNHDRFFYNNQNDPGYQQWRAEAEKMSADNADLKAKLAALDAKMTGLQASGVVADAGKLPDDVTLDVAIKSDALVHPDTHWSTTTKVLVTVGVAAVLVVFMMAVM